MAKPVSQTPELTKTYRIPSARSRGGERPTAQNAERCLDAPSASSVDEEPTDDFARILLTSEGAISRDVDLEF